MTGRRPTWRNATDFDHAGPDPGAVGARSADAAVREHDAPGVARGRDDSSLVEHQVPVHLDADHPQTGGKFARQFPGQDHLGPIEYQGQSWTKFLDVRLSIQTYAPET